MAANSYRRTLTEYGADPNDGRAIGLAAQLWRRVQATWATRYGIANGAPEVSFTGTVERSLPMMAGAAPLGANTNPYRGGGAATIETGLVEGPMGDPARRIFAQRMQRRNGGGGSA